MCSLGLRRKPHPQADTSRAGRGPRPQPAAQRLWTAPDSEPPARRRRFTVTFTRAGPDPGPGRGPTTALQLDSRLGGLGPALAWGAQSAAVRPSLSLSCCQCASARPGPAPVGSLLGRRTVTVTPPSQWQTSPRWVLSRSRLRARPRHEADFGFWPLKSLKLL